MMNSTASFSQKKIKVAVVYTKEAKKSVTTGFEQKAKNQINIIENILKNSGIDDVGIEVSYTKLHRYKEPKYRSNGYVRFAFNGTHQIMEEISNHWRIMHYLIENNINSFDENGINYIDKDELSRSLISIKASTKPNVVLFIADEDGDPNISQPIENITERSSETYFSIINSESFSKIDISLALGFFGIFTDEYKADLDKDNVASKSSFMSSWHYNNFNVQRKLSDENVDLFRCNLSKLKLTSPEKMEMGGVYITASTQNNVMDVEDYMTIGASSSVNKRAYSLIAPDGEDYSIVMVSKRQRVDNPFCISDIGTEKMYYINDTSLERNDERIVLDNAILAEDIDLFTPVKTKVYPNPTTGKVTYELVLSASGEYRFTLYNSYGQEVNYGYKSMRTGFNRVQEDYSNFDSGVYIYRITSKNTEPITGKIILNR